METEIIQPVAALSNVNASLGLIPNKRPICVIVLGMAGSGKTTFVKKLAQYRHANGSLPYLINLDPACHETPYPVNIGMFYIIRIVMIIEHSDINPFTVQPEQYYVLFSLILPSSLCILYSMCL